MPDRVNDLTQELSNAYCASANVPVPRLERVIAEFPKAKLLHLMVVALLEQGAPMSLESIADRLDKAGVLTGTGDTRASLLKAWHGLKPVYRNDRDWFALDTSTWEFRSILFQLNLRKVPRPTFPSPPALEPVADDIPLTEVEVRAAFAAASRDSLSVPRRIAAILDVLNAPTNRVAVEACLREWNSTYQSVNDADLQRWSKSCVLVLEGDSLQIDRESSHLYPLRRSVRKLAERTLRRTAIEEASKQRQLAYETQKAERQVRDRGVAQQLRRAIIRVVPDHETPAAAAVLDVANRTIRTFVGPELRDLPQVLGNYDLIATLWVREALYSLNLRDHDPWILVDLQPPPKNAANQPKGAETADYTGDAAYQHNRHQSAPGRRRQARRILGKWPNHQVATPLGERCEVAVRVLQLRSTSSPCAIALGISERMLRR